MDLINLINQLRVMSGAGVEEYGKLADWLWWRDGMGWRGMKGNGMG